MPSSPGPPRRKHRHKHRSKSRSPRDKGRHSKKRAHKDPDIEHGFEERKHHHKSKHRSHNPPLSDADDDNQPTSHRHRPKAYREDSQEAPPQPHTVVKREAGAERESHKYRKVTHEPGIKREASVKQEPDSDDAMGHRQSQQRERHRHDRKRQENRRRQGNNRWTNDDEEGQFGGGQQQGAPAGDGEDEEEPVEKEKPNFELSGKLTEETNTYRGVVIKYSEPPEARKPKKRWRLYPFKEGEALSVLHIHRQSAYLMGRDRKIADIPIDHPSCSKQHSVLQYRLVPYQRENGSTGHAVRPYIIDLGSTNGTHVNNNRIEAQRYVQLLEQDVLKFGFSSREYVLLHDKSKGQEPEDDEGESN